METEGFAIYDAMMQLKNEVTFYKISEQIYAYSFNQSFATFYVQIHTVGVGAAIGHACLLLAAGSKGKRFMMPHAKGTHIIIYIFCYISFLYLLYLYLK